MHRTATSQPLRCSSSGTLAGPPPPLCRGANCLASFLLHCPQTNTPWPAALVRRLFIHVILCLRALPRLCTRFCWAGFQSPHALLSSFVSSCALLCFTRLLSITARPAPISWRHLILTSTLSMTSFTARLWQAGTGRQEEEDATAGWRRQRMLRRPAGGSGGALLSPRRACRLPLCSSHELVPLLDPPERLNSALGKAPCGQAPAAARRALRVVSISTRVPGASSLSPQRCRRAAPL